MKITVDSNFLTEGHIILIAPVSSFFDRLFFQDVSLRKHLCNHTVPTGCGEAVAESQVGLKGGGESLSNCGSGVLQQYSSMYCMYYLCCWSWTDGAVVSAFTSFACCSTIICMRVHTHTHLALWQVTKQQKHNKS